MEVRVEGEDISAKEIEEEQGWKTIHAPNKKNTASDKDVKRDKQGDAKSADADEHKRRTCKNIQKMIAAPKKPHLPKEDIKSVAQIGDCIRRASGLKPEEVVKDSVRINERQNIVEVSTPVLERADIYSAMKDFCMGAKTYEVTAYMTAPKGIIRGIPDYDTPEDIEKSLVNKRNPGILHAKRMGRTNHAIIVFRGVYVPRYVYYRSCDAEPTPDHRCEPKCLVCGRDHPTGDRKCKARFKTPYLIKKRQWERTLPESASRERQRTENEKRVDNAAALDNGRDRRSRSRSRTRSRSITRTHGDGPQTRTSSGPRARSRSTSRNGTTPMQRKDGETGSGHHGPLDVSWADAVYCGRAKVEAAPCNTNAETNKELAQIKQMLLQLTEDNAKLRDEINALKEENARLRNAGKDAKDVAQITVVPKDVIQAGEEQTVPTKRRAIEVASECSESRGYKRDSMTKRWQEQLELRMEEDKKGLETKIEGMFAELIKLMQQQFTTMQQQIQQQLGTMQARVGELEAKLSAPVSLPTRGSQASS
ncbi:hypothetical protein HPB50_018711 [Hyalomma asiaticum]|uniref:Uncharacterized protein n=1 Tax=Hyalomma asiaticum TaxID=266040 RepID=A0ACB7RXQ8_HYAAI|nr:hypothetical protein HPB50_018711 [Hyalomma asiaticum]